MCRSDKGNNCCKMACNPFMFCCNCYALVAKIAKVLGGSWHLLFGNKYVLNCFLGMHYSDLNKREPHFFSKKSIAGKEFVVYTGRAKKTDQEIEFAVHPKL